MIRRLLLVAVLAFLTLPLLVILPISLTPERYLSFPTDSWSLRHYRSLIENPDWSSALLTSLGIGLVSALLATVLAAAFCIGLWLNPGRRFAAVQALVLLPMLIPGVVTAIALYFGLARLGLIDTLAGTVAAHTLLAVPFAVISVGVALSGLDPKLAQAARSLGARPLRIVLDVVLPLIRPGLVAAFLLSFFISWEEIVVTIFITTSDVVTLPRLIWQELRNNISPAIAAVAVVMTLVTLLALIVRLLLTARGAEARP